MSDTAGTSLTVETKLLDDIRPLVPLVDPRHPLAFIRRGQGMAGIGEALRLEFTGPTRMVDAAAAWKVVAAAARVTDSIGLPGTGLVAFGAFAFSDASAQSSVLIVPSVLIGRRDGVTWITRVGTAALPEPTPFGADPGVEFSPGSLSNDGYLAAVDNAIRRIRSHSLSKVVLARDLVGRLPENADLRPALAALALGYPDCWTFAVDGLVGSSPETLVRVSNGSVSARVLAGSAGRGSDPLSDQEAAVALGTSTKDLDEHRYAVQSVLVPLAPHTKNLAVTEIPFTLKLPNLWHLATDVEATLTDGSSSLDLIAALHPTAAVGGTPRERAVALIDELEPFDRRRYAGPVGWVGADGDGDWAIALRCAEVSPGGVVTAYAGAGIVGESVAERELAETRMKLRPIVDTFA